MGKLKDALSAYDKAIKANPNFADAYYNKGTIHSKLGEKLKALEDYKKAI